MHTFFEFQLKVGGVLAVGVLIYLLFLSRDNSFNRNRLWLLGCLIVPWIVPLMAMPMQLKQWLFREEVPVRDFVINHYVTDSTATMVQVPQTNFLTWENGLWLAFALIGVILLLRLLMACFSVFQLRRKSQKSSYSGLRLRLFKNLSIVPFSFFRTIYAPKEIEESNDYQLILEHESTHCKQLHSIDIMMAEVVLLLLWWNPFAWWLRKLIAQNHEYCVDNSMLKKVDEPSRYQYLLVNLLSSNSSLQLVNSFNGSFTKKRIVMMNKNKSNHIINKLKMVPIVGVLVCAFSAFTNPDLTIVPTPQQNISVSDLIEKANVDVENVADSTKGSDEEVIAVMGFSAKDSVIIDKDGGLELHGDVDIKVVEGEKQPLVIIDEKEETMQVLNNLDPSEIGNVTVIKDASAISLYGDKAKNGVIIVHKTISKDKGIVVVEKNKIDEAPVVKIKDSNESFSEALVIVDGEEMPMDEFNTLKPNSIKSIDVMKGQAAIDKYGDKGKHGIIQVVMYREGEKTFVEKNGHMLVHNKPLSLRESKQGLAFSIYPSQRNPIYMVDGKEMSASDVNNIDALKIASISVLKDASAINKYGEKAKDGVVEISLKQDGDASSRSEISDDIKTIKATKRSFKFSTKGIEGMQGNPLVYIDGEKSSIAELQKESATRIKTIDVLKGEQAIDKYGDEAKDGVLLVTLHSSVVKALESDNQIIYDDRIPNSTKGRTFKMTISKSKGRKFLIDGKEATYEEVNQLDPQAIERIDITKDPEVLKEIKHASKIGVVRITLKK
ncbi:M56 family metallopeptidase [Labilibacter marinus]|uniref:M56 family metallopeptidase n=1 Tax=Labilibacter marinus TaxID=1477105 RepID=UPI00082CAD9F|nr:M56 family metallopeptidase [Labilibacter marinus]